MATPTYMKTKITNLEEAHAFIKALHADGNLFHFDDYPEEILADNSSAMLFTLDECFHLNNRIAEVFQFDADPFALCVALIDGETT